MLREPLPSELATLSAEDDVPSDEDWFSNMMQDSEMPDACDLIRQLCDVVRQLTDAQREKFWEILRMPITPATLVSAGAGIAARMKVVPHEFACVAGLLSLVYSLWKGLGYLDEHSCSVQSRATARSQIHALLPFVHERDLLTIRSLLDAVPEVRDQCSDW